MTPEFGHPIPIPTCLGNFGSCDRQETVNNGYRLVEARCRLVGHEMCALIGCRRGPAGHHRWATSRTRARSSPSSSRTSFSSSTCACCARVDRGWKSRSSTSLPRRAVTCCPPAEWREDDAYRLCGPEGLGLETGRWHWGASRDESVVAWLKPDHTWNMALGCSIPARPHLTLPLPDRPRSSHSTFPFFNILLEKLLQKRWAAG